MTVDYSSDLLRNVHRDIPAPEVGQSFFVQGDYEYWHYGCDGFNDKVCNLNLFFGENINREERKTMKY